MRVVFATTVVALLLVGSSGCGAGYLVRQAAGQVQILAQARPLASLDAKVPAQEAAFARVERVLVWARAAGLEVGASYRSYVDLGGRPPVWVLFASPPDRLESYEWRFPLVGSFSYKGFFDRSAAVREERVLRAAGYETYIGAGGAYSTLGWFDDPLFRRFLDTAPGDLEETVFHELTHATVFFPDQLRFNENLAEFVGGVLAARLLAATFGADSVELSNYQERLRDRARLREVMAAMKQDLLAAYERPTRDERLQERARVFAELREKLAQTPFETEYAQGWQDVEWSNPRVLALDLYRADQEVFAELLAACDGDLPRFLAVVASLRGQDDLVAALHAAVDAQGATSS
ncbi:MAG: aminopeptidase [Planctomycetota bacterium]